MSSAITRNNSPFVQLVAAAFRAANPAQLELSETLISRLYPLWAVFVQEGRRVGLSPYLLASMAMRESSLVPTARGPEVPSSRITSTPLSWMRIGQARGLGLMQLMSFHDRRYGGHIDSLLERYAEPSFNVHYGANIIRDSVSGQKGDIKRGLAAYGGFSTWLRGKPGSANVSGQTYIPGGKLDAAWYIDDILGRALVIEWHDRLGSLGLPRPVSV